MTLNLIFPNTIEVLSIQIGNILLSIVEVLLFFVCVLFSVAYLTVAERKTLGYMQRRVGPNVIG